jgi:hypothetical protein
MTFVLNFSRQKWDWLLVMLLAWALFLFDVSMNKVADLGINYKAHLTETILFPMVAIMWIGGFLVLILTGVLVARAIINRKGWLLRDTIVGIFALFCFGFLLLGGVLQVLHIDQFPFFIWIVNTITIYHIIAIVGYLLASIYYVVTE